MKISEQRQQIAQTYDLIASPLGICEPRILKVGKYRQTGSGCFEAGQRKAFVESILECAALKPSGIYVTLNPASFDLLARCANRMQLPSEHTTKDEDIVWRHRLLLDFDAKRPAGISSTNAEHEAALAKARECRDFLHEAHGIICVLADSGNGAHLLIPINLPNDADSKNLTVAFLKAIAERFDHPLIKLDQSVFNASRISKVYGTKAAKGDDTPERPHRYARLLEVPDELPIVPVEVLRAVAGVEPAKTRNKPVKSPVARPGSSGDTRFDVPAYLAQHGLTVHNEKDGKEGCHHWNLEACPFDAGHQYPDSFIGQYPNGAVMFHCRHDSCKAKGWHDVRRLLEPGWKPYETPQEQYRKGQAHQNSKSETGEAGSKTAGEDTNTENTDNTESADKELPYVETHMGLLWLRQTRDGLVKTPLTNFTARIIADILEDDGAETSLRYHIQARRNGKQTCFIIPADTFNGFGWVSEHLGIGAACYPGTLTKEHAQFAIRQISEAQGATREITYTHTGWRELEAGQWAYLHAGGVIGALVPPGVNVRLSDIGKHYVLPELTDPSDLQAAIRATLNLATLGPDVLTLPLIAAIFRAALQTADFSLSLSGPSGAFKSELAALAQRHYGAEMDANHLPGSWSSTENALEELAFRVKDALLVIDDFAPTGSQHDIARLHAKADRVLRAQGNGSGRQRMRRDGTLYAARPPRGLILSTGEDIPQGKSLRARQFILEVGPTDIDVAKLTACQKDAAAGLYAQCMAGFLTWLAPQYAQVRAGYSEHVERLRAQVVQKLRADGHRRTPDIVADLALGRHYFLQFAQESGVLTEEEAKVWHNRFAAAFLGAANTQALHQHSSDPALRFLDLVRSALSSGTAHVADMDGNFPDTPEAWGWRLKVVGTGEYERSEWQAQGERIGWTEGENLYLEKDAAFKAIRKQGGEGEGVTLTPTVLYKRLLEGHHLASTEKHSSRGTLHVRKRAEGKVQNVLHLYSEALLREKTDISDISDLDAEEV